MGASFVSPRSWSAERPRALVVCCSDGRWHAQVEDFLRSQQLDGADLYAVPGGAVCFDAWNSSVSEAWAMEASFRLLMEHHAIESVWLIAHEGCAYYRVKHGARPAPELRGRQHEDLATARRFIRARHPRLSVACVYASVVDGRVDFTTLGAE